MKTFMCWAALFALLLAMCAAGSVSAAAQDFSGAVIFYEAGFPSADSAAPSHEQLSAALPGAHFVSTDELTAALDSPTARLLILPYGSAFPEQGWSAIFAFLQRGGNLLVLGGRPLTRAAYRDGGSWKLREYSVRFARQLLIDQYQDTPGSDGLEFETNPEVTFQPSRFTWNRAFSPVIRLSAVDLYNRGGSAGSIDARLDTLAWGAKDGRKLAAPMIEIDHQRNGFDGGRWIFVQAELNNDFFSREGKLVRDAAERAIQGNVDFTVRPTLPLYLLGEPLELDVHWQAAAVAAAAATVKVTVFPEAQPANGAAGWFTDFVVARSGEQTFSRCRSESSRRRQRAGDLSLPLLGPRRRIPALRATLHGEQRLSRDRWQAAGRRGYHLHVQRRAAPLLRAPECLRLGSRSRADSRSKIKHAARGLVDRLGQILRRKRPALRTHLAHYRSVFNDRA